MACSAVDRADHSPGLGYLPQPTARQGQTKWVNRRVRTESAATPGCAPFFAILDFALERGLREKEHMISLERNPGARVSHSSSASQPPLSSYAPSAPSVWTGVSAPHRSIAERSTVEEPGAPHAGSPGPQGPLRRSGRHPPTLLWGSAGRGGRGSGPAKPLGPEACRPAENHRG